METVDEEKLTWLRSYHNDVLQRLEARGVLLSEFRIPDAADGGAVKPESQ